MSLTESRRLLSPLCAAAMIFNFVAADAFAKRKIRYGDLTFVQRGLLDQRGVGAGNFEAYVVALERRTDEREAWGENDHLIYYVLQSERFTRQRKIEPALSARDLVGSLSPAEKQKYLGDTAHTPPIEKLPSDVAARFKDFVKAIKTPKPGDERLNYFKAKFFVEGRFGDMIADPDGYLYEQYARSMKFLYEKEFLAPAAIDARSVAARVAKLYEERGHSTDTTIEANFVVHQALAALKAQRPDARFDNVLIVGPGMDFAPRTDLIDLFEPQSYQPYAVADALLALGLTDLNHLRVHCVDINPRVVSHLNARGYENSTQLSVLSILSGIADSPRRPLSSEYKNYFARLGDQIGFASDLSSVPNAYARHLRRRVTVNRQVDARISAEVMNVIIEREELPAPREYDLVIVTNVFPYFGDAEVLLALSNIASMMKEGGYLLHNENRPTLLALAGMQNLPLSFSRTALIAGRPDDRTALHDGVWAHRKSAPRKK